MINWVFCSKEEVILPPNKQIKLKQFMYNRKLNQPKFISLTDNNCEQVLYMV